MNESAVATGLADLGYVVERLFRNDAKPEGGRYRVQGEPPSNNKSLAEVYQSFCFDEWTVDRFEGGVYKRVNNLAVSDTPHTIRYKARALLVMQSRGKKKAPPYLNSDKPRADEYVRKVQISGLLGEHLSDLLAGFTGRMFTPQELIELRLGEQ